MKSANLAIVLIAGAALLLGCAQPKPFEYHSGNEIPEGPGLFTGEDGAVRLKLPDGEKSEPPAVPEARREETPPHGDISPAESGEPAETPEFREFQQWRKERKEFEAFRQWKRSREGSAEYQEFRDWRRWQEYKRWQESQSKDR